MRVVLRILTFSLAALTASFVGLYFYLQDTARLKPEVESLIADQTGINVKIHGDLRWQLLPPLTLSIEDLEVIEDGLRVRAEALDLTMDLSAMWQDTDSWRVEALHLTHTIISDGLAAATLTRFDLTDFRPGQPAQLLATGHYQPEGEQSPYSGTLKGTVIYEPETEASTARVRLEATELETPELAAVCDLTLSPNGRSLPAPPESGNEILPVAALRTIDLQSDCSITRLRIAGETFSDGSLKLTNQADTTSLALELPDFLGGQASTEINIDLAAQPIRWLITPQADAVDSTRLLSWADQPLHWVARVNHNGRIQMAGNTQAALMASVRSEQSFDGGKGEIDITGLKQQLTQLAVLTGGSDSFSQWPDTWAYNALAGKLKTQGRQQTLDLQVDNLTIRGSGIYNYTDDSLDMLANVVFTEAPADSPYVVNPLLQDTPLPMRCQGTTGDLSCKLDGDATQKLIAKALQRDSDTGLRRKLENTIDEKVPEEYREAARGLLDFLGRALDSE